MAKTKTNDNERLYVIPLTDAWKAAYKRRAKKCVAVIKQFASKHMKKDLKSVKIGSKLNDLVWSRGIKSPPRKVKVRVLNNEDSVWVGLQDEKLVFEVEAEKKAEEEKKKVKEDKAKKTEAKPKADAKAAKTADVKTEAKKAEAKPKVVKAEAKAKAAPKKEAAKPSKAKEETKK